MMMNITRRKLVTMLGGAAGVSVTATFVAHADRADTTKDPSEVLAKVPWPYKLLDPDKVAQRGFDGYKKDHCMYGGFESITGTVAEQLGTPYTNFPFSMFHYGLGGVYNWATLCGAVNGACAAIQLLSPNPEPLIDSLMTWYEHQALPNFYPKGAKFPEVRSVAGSPLCHQSIAHWTTAANKVASSPERLERCGTLTASVARQAVILLNDQAASKPITFVLPKETQACISCHERGGALDNVRTKMDCGGCHAPLMGKHPAKL
jgi:hypothetical protein